MANKIAVLGSINIDTTYRVNEFPKPGQTIQALSKSSTGGGKGNNQAVAAARSEAQTYFIGMVGTDDEGKFMLENLAEEGINTDLISQNKEIGTGTALVTLNSSGQNDIMVYGGANQAMTTEVLNGSEAVLAQVDFLLAQNETPQEVTLAAFKLAKSLGVKTIFNPAPAGKIMPALLEYTDIIIPNETECQALTGSEITDEVSMQAAANAFKEMGVGTLLITLGSKGVYYSTPSSQGLVPAFKVQALDTTAAGDTFIGALASQLSKDLSNIVPALTYAQKASSLAVQKMGAASSIPSAEEIFAQLK
mgnify:FL=1